MTPTTVYHHHANECNCGSGEFASWEYDAQGIPPCKCCDQCRDERPSHYRPEILHGYDQSDVDETIEPEDDGFGLC
jgi:hypothetical protein